MATTRSSALLLAAANNQPGAALNRKRKAAADDKLTASNAAKRAALGEITNKKSAATTANVSEKATGSKGGFLSGLLRRSLRRSKKVEKEDVKKAAAIAEKAENESYGESESSTEILACVLESSTSTLGSTTKLAQDFTVVSPPRPILPPGVDDFDLLNKNDPIQHSEYAAETFQYYKNREMTFRIPDYMHAQKDVNAMMRAILIDWLVEVQESFELNHETLYSAVKICDLYLSKKQVKRDNLQLLGATATFIASKVEERLPPMLDDFLYVCDDAYTRNGMLAMERKILATIGFDLGFPLTYRFLRRYARVCQVEVTELTFARYILESSLMEYSLNVETSESHVAAAVLVLALKVRGIEGWEANLEYYSGHTVTSLKDTVATLQSMLLAPPKDNMQTVRSKYEHKVFHHVAKIVVPEEPLIL
eukprot:TRINITY_DN1635_c1_g1_i14.p1 TRINITY_DN1635_c1_g1~~TRINITY_DN1635_c1_g1_i14.p1  ORF type:complete len:422 (-),score=118.39 TRINITY_DN1635_c1_g1_i14:977-2242(-)